MDWSRLTAAISSELLSFDEAADVMLARSHSAGGTPRTLAAGGAASAAGERGSGEITSPRSPGGERLEINSGVCGPSAVVSRAWQHACGQPARSFQR